MEKCKWLENSRSEMRWVGEWGFRREFGRIPGERARVSLALQIGREFINGTELPFFLLSLQQKRSRGREEREERVGLLRVRILTTVRTTFLILFWTDMGVPLVFCEITKRAIVFSKPLYSFPILLPVLCVRYDPKLIRERNRDGASQELTNLWSPELPLSGP